MDYEKKYNKMLDDARYWHDVSEGDIPAVLEEIFPELAESEDEKIRKEIIAIFEGKIPYTSEEDSKRYIAWLEKLKVFAEHGDGLYYFTNSEFTYVGNPTWDNVSFLEKQGEPSDEDMKTLLRIEYEKGRADAIAEMEDKAEKKFAETYLVVFDKKFPILPTLKGKQLADYKNFLNKCQQILGLKYWDIHPTQAKLFEKLSLLWVAWGAEHLQGLRQVDGDVDNEKQGEQKYTDDLTQQEAMDIAVAKCFEQQGEQKSIDKTQKRE